MVQVLKIQTQNEVISLSKKLNIPLVSSAGHGDVISFDYEFMQVKWVQEVIKLLHPCKKCRFYYSHWDKAWL